MLLFECLEILVGNIPWWLVILHIGCYDFDLSSICWRFWSRSTFDIYWCYFSGWERSRTSIPHWALKGGFSISEDFGYINHTLYGIQYPSYSMIQTGTVCLKLTRIGEGDRIGDGDDIRLICLSGFILSSTIAVKFEFLFHVQHTHLIFCIILYN